MNSNQDSQKMENIIEEIKAENALSIDDFIRELEAKEKDLQIFSEVVIEVDENDFDSENAAEFQSAAGFDTGKITPEIKESKANAVNNDEIIKLKDETSNLQNQISKMKTERVELVDLARRRQTDFDNYKNRTERERSEIYRNQLSNLAQQLLPVLDNMHRALTSVTDIAESNTQELEQFFEGIGLVNQQMNEILGEMGVQPIISVGQTFDPHLHEAVATEETNEFPPHTVTAEFLRGYRIAEKIIRPAMVKVSARKDE